MNGIAVLVTLAVVGVDYGWQPTSDGQLEYIIQIEPELLDSLKNGAEIASAIHPDARGVRRFRIKVGKERLPRIGTLQSNTVPTRLSASDAGTFPVERGGNGASATLSGSAPEVTASNVGQRDSSDAMGETRSSEEFGPDGFLNLPPPPSIGMDGKSSVLVRPGSRASSSSAEALGDRVGPLPSLDRISPPAPPDTATSSSSTPSRFPASSASGGSWQPPVTTGPTGNRFPASDSTDANLPDPPADWGSPGGVDRSTPPADQPTVRPIPAPSNDYGSPSPILGGRRGEVLPPQAENATAEVLPPKTSQLEQPVKRKSGSQSEAGSKDLLASVTDRGTAMQKPTLGEKEAEELKEMERQAKPWSTLVLTSMALFASLAANVYLGWVALGIYRRYRDVAGQLSRVQASLT